MNQPNDKDTDDLRQIRLDKLDELREMGIEAYPVEAERSHTAGDVRTGFDELEGKEVAVVGRLTALRLHGKAGFADINDATGRIQIYFKKNNLPDDFDTIKKILDLGDFINVWGQVFKTKTGEVTVEVKQFKFLAKSLRPLPIVKKQESDDGTVTTYDAFADPEKRFRKRYLDMLVNPESRERIRARARMTADVRAFMDNLGFLEIETPILQPIYGGANAAPFKTFHNDLEMELFLRIADELYLKRLLVGGFEKVYEVCKDFRNESIDRTHYPEFSMLEFYQAYATYEDCIELVEAIVCSLAEKYKGGLKFDYQGKTLDLTPPWKRIEVVPAIQKATGLDVFDCTEKDLAGQIKKLGGEVKQDWTRPKLIDELLDLVIEEEVWNPCFVLGHPAELSPLAKRRKDDPRLAERFELFIIGMEFGNSFSEQNDPLLQREALEAQAAARLAGDVEAQTVDEDFLEAMEYGMPPAGGMGLGLDRLFMLLTDAPNIREVLAFPQLREVKDK
ncbi:MAG: lysine--tRNA ligase [bacterium]|nr:lysine--tRNA ligase [bacterium]